MPAHAVVVGRGGGGATASCAANRPRGKHGFNHRNRGCCPDQTNITNQRAYRQRNAEVAAKHSTNQSGTAWRYASAYSTTKHSTAKHCTTKHSTAKHSTAKHSTAKHGTAKHSTAKHGTAKHGTAKHSTTKHGTAKHSTTKHGTAKRRCDGRACGKPII